MLALDVDDEMALQALPVTATADDVQAALERVAERHGVGWVDWPTWRISGLRELTPLVWAAAMNETGLHPKLVGLAFRHYLPTLKTPPEVQSLFSAMAESLRSFALAEAGPADAAAENDIKTQAVDSIVQMLLAVGKEDATLAHAALSFATNHFHSDWMGRAWLVANSAFVATAIASETRVPDESASESRKEREKRTGLR